MIFTLITWHHKWPSKSLLLVSNDKPLKLIFEPSPKHPDLHPYLLPMVYGTTFKQVEIAKMKQTKTQLETPNLQ